MKKENITGFLVGLVMGIAVTITAFVLINKNKNNIDKVKKFKIYYQMLNQWMILRNYGITLENYFVNCGYKTIAIYGMGEMGERFYEEIKQSSNLEIKYAIDKNADHVMADLKVYDLENNLPKVDIIVVTSVFAYDEIKLRLHKKVDYPITSLDRIIQDLL